MTGDPLPQPVPGRRKYNAFVAVVFSFFSADLYRDVANRWGAGSGSFYLVLAMFLTLIPL